MEFEDFAVGDRFTSPPVRFTETDIVAFARQFDPQPFHLDADAGKASIYGGLIASGWHVLCRMFRETVDLGLYDGGGQGAPGLDDVRWRIPVRPDDELTISVIIDDKRTSATHANRGYVFMRFEIANQHEERVASYRVREIFRVRGS